MTDDDKALVERLRGKADWLDPEIDMIEEWEALDAAARIEDLLKIQEGLLTIHKAHIAENGHLRAENERLREAGKDLGFYAGHDDSCDCVKGWAKGPCNCGYTETWKQWSAALGETK